MDNGINQGYRSKRTVGNSRPIEVGPFIGGGCDRGGEGRFRIGGAEYVVLESNRYSLGYPN